MTCASSKGQLGFEVAWVAIVLVVVAMGFLFAYPAFKELNDDIQADTTLSSVAKDTAQTTVGNYPSTFDGVFFFLFIMLWIFLIIIFYFGASEPVWMVISLILVIISLAGTMFLGNAYEEFTLDGEVSSFTTAFPKMSWILDHLLLVVLMQGFSVATVLYVRS